MLFALCLSGRVLPLYANSVNLLTNGSFEDPVIPFGSQCGPFAHCLGFHNGVAGNDNIGGWQLIGKGGVDSNGRPIPNAPGTVMLLGYDYAEPDSLTGRALHFHPQNGSQSLDLTGEGNQGLGNGIKQSVATNQGERYRLTFWVGHQYSLAPGYEKGPGAAAVFIDGETIGSFASFGNTFEDVTWTRFSYAFAASSPQTVLAFLNDTPVGNNYSGLDNVSLIAIPEPAAVVLVGAGSVCLFFFRRRLSAGL